MSAGALCWLLEYFWLDVAIQSPVISPFCLGIQV